MAKATPPAAGKAKKPAKVKATKREIAANAPDVRRRQNLTTHGRHIDPELVDPEFLSEADMAKREAFAQAFVALGTLTDAAQTAGYTGTRQSLRKSGWRLYNEPWVKARIEEIRADLLAELRITQRSVLAELSRIGFADMGNVVDEHDRIKPLKDIHPDTRRALAKYKQTRRIIMNGDAEPIEEIETEVNFEGKTAALDKLGKHTGLFGKADDDGPGVAAEDFIRALGEGIARVIAGKRTIEHQP